MTDSLTPNRANPSEQDSRPEQRDDATRRKRQLEILDLFGTIDFDPEYDPIRLRKLDRIRTIRRTRHP